MRFYKVAILRCFVLRQEVHRSEMLNAMDFKLRTPDQSGNLIEGLSNQLVKRQAIGDNRFTLNRSIVHHLFDVIQCFFDAMSGLQSVGFVNNRCELEIDHAEPPIRCAVSHISQLLILVSNSIRFKRAKDFIQLARAQVLNGCPAMSDLDL